MIVQQFWEFGRNIYDYWGSGSSLALQGGFPLWAWCHGKTMNFLSFFLSSLLSVLRIPFTATMTWSTKLGVNSDVVINCNVYPSHLHRNLTPEHCCLPSPRLAVAPCLFRSATLKRVRSETVSRSVAFRMLCNQIHRYGGLLKIHIITKIYTGVRCEPVYHPAPQD